MKQTLLLLTVLLLVVVPGTAKAQPIAFTGVTVIDVAEGVALPDMNVVVTGNRISAMGEADEVEIPEGATVIDGNGKFLIPGLWDMHVHSSSDSITRNVFLPLYIANGVTGVRDLTGDCFPPCSSIESSVVEARQWRKEIADGRLVGPVIISSSPIIYGQQPGEPSSVEEPATAEEGRALVQLMADRGVDFIKVYDEVSREAFFGIMDEANQLGLPVVGHVPLGVPVSEAAEAGMRSMEHLFPVIDECSSREDELRPQQVEAARNGEVRLLNENWFRSMAAFRTEKCDSLYQALALHEVWQVPTLITSEAAENGVWWRDDPRMVYIPRKERDLWMWELADGVLTLPGGLSGLPVVTEKIRQISLDMFRAGVPVLAGSDTGMRGIFPGFSLHEELEALVRVGLSPADALRAATFEPAVYLEATDSLGTVQAGKLADLVLLEANPLEDIVNTQRIMAVVTRGRLFDRNALDELMAGAKRAAQE